MSKVYVFKAKKPQEVYINLKIVSPLVDKDTVIIKPNIVVATKPSSGVITHFKIVEGIIKYLKEIGIKNIFIAESPGLNVNIQDAFRIGGFLELSQKENVKLLDLEKEPKVEKNWRYGTIKLPKILFEAYYINVPKLKTHMQTVVTLGLKNQKGILSSEDKKKFHILWGLDEPIAELAKIIRPDLTILDGLIGIEGDGPLFQGKKVKSNIMAISSDLLALDSTCCRIMGIDPLTVAHINFAHQYGIGDMHPMVIGTPVAEVRRNFKLPNMEYFKMAKLFNIRNKWACSMCSDSLRAALKMTLTSPILFIKYMPKWIYLILFKGVYFIAGPNADIKNSYAKIICMGNCAKKIAEEYSFCLANGCPPSPKEILKSL